MNNKVKRVIHLVNTIKPKSIGVWGAAISTAEYLRNKYEIESILITNQKDKEIVIESVLNTVLIKIWTNPLTLLEQINIHPRSTIINTHGSWSFPTKWGCELSKKGYKWVHHPQGSLEPWALSHKWLKKLIYSELFEYRYVRRGAILRSVSSPEHNNLNILFPDCNVAYIPNGVDESPTYESKEFNQEIDRFLFMSRLHHKKSIFALVKAWTESSCRNNPKYELIIAGHDENQLNAITPMIKKSGNVKYVGYVKGKEKCHLINSCCFFVLPTQSEGFSTALLEALARGLIPLYTDGCNFPELEKEQLGIKIKPNTRSILDGLKRAIDMPFVKRETQSKKIQEFIRDNFSLSLVAEKQLQLYNQLLDWGDD